MRQKFKAFTFVRVTDENGDFDGIVKGSYSQQLGGSDTDSYEVFVVENGKVVDCRAWFDEEQLAPLPEQDYDQAMTLAEDYQVGDDEDDQDD